MKILFIEDNMDLITSMKCQFEMHGYNDIDFCENGTCALTKLSQFKYDLIILDIVLPDIDGLVVLEKIKEDSSLNINTFIIVTTGITHKTLVDNAETLGVNYFISKPYQFSNLMSIAEVVRKILNIGSSPKKSSDDLETFCDNYLKTYDIHENLKGYNLIVQAFNYLVSNDNAQNPRITKDIYPHLAKANATDVTNIERNIRNALNSSELATQEELTNLSFLLKMKKSYYMAKKTSLV